MQLFVGLTNVRLQSLSDYQVFLSMAKYGVYTSEYRSEGMLDY